MLNVKLNSRNMSTIKDEEALYQNLKNLSWTCMYTYVFNICILYYVFNIYIHMCNMYLYIYMYWLLINPCRWWSNFIQLCIVQFYLLQVYFSYTPLAIKCLLEFPRGCSNMCTYIRHVHVYMFKYIYAYILAAL